MSQEKVFQARKDQSFPWFETSQDQQEKFVNECGWEGRVLFTQPDKQAETLEAERDQARAACDAQGELTQKYQALALAGAQSPTIKQLAAQLDSNEKWTIAEQQAFAPFLAQFPNESSQGILSLGSAWKHGIAYAQSLATPQQHAQAAQPYADNGQQHKDPTGPNHPGQHDGHTCAAMGQMLADFGSQRTTPEAVVARMDAQAALSDEQIRVDLMRAATNCGHSIDSEQVILYREDGRHGNALAQLTDRLLVAHKATLAAQQPAAAPVAAAVQGLRGKSIEIKVGDGWVPAKFIATDLVGGEPIVQMPGRMPEFYTWPEVRGLTAAEARAALAQRADSKDSERDAALYRWLLENYAFGDGYSDIDAALNNGEADKYLTPAIIAAMAAQQSEKR